MLSCEYKQHRGQHRATLSTTIASCANPCVENQATPRCVGLQCYKTCCFLRFHEGNVITCWDYIAQIGQLRCTKIGALVSYALVSKDTLALLAKRVYGSRTIASRGCMFASTASTWCSIPQVTAIFVGVSALRLGIMFVCISQ